MFSVLVGVTIMVSLNHHFPNVNKQVILTIDDNISHLSTKLATENAKILKYKKKRKEKITQESNMLQNKLAVDPIDKASGYVAYVCLRHYAQVSIDELGLKQNYS